MTEERSEAGWLAKLHFAEDTFNVVVLVVMAVLPLIEIVTRTFGVSVPGSIQYVSMLTMWIGFTGAMLATRDDKHLAISVGSALLTGRAEQVARGITVFVASVITAVLAWGAWLVVESEMASTQTIPPGIPVWIGQVVMPIGYALIALRLILVKYRSWVARGVLVVLVGVTLYIAYGAEAETAEAVLWPCMVIALIATGLGAPIYVALGAAAVLLFWANDTTVAAVAAATVGQIKHPIMPSIPLFTFTGYILAESKASTRLVRAFRALFGWVPGGTAVMTAVVCAFFTTFTGASGVTILALGGLLYPVLRKELYPKGFSVGMLTASGSIGLLFPPSLPVILYAVTAKVPVDKMFVAGVLPGVVLVAAVAMLGVRTGLSSEVKRAPFELNEALAAIKGAAWELALPVLVIGGIFLGLTTLVEAAALTAAYALFVEVVVYKDLSIRRDLVRVGRDCAGLVGGVLVILGVAMGFTSFLVDEGVPELALEWVQGGIESKYVFLIVLNVFLLIVGCLMDIFSAIIVVVPLILPIGRHFGIDPIHLGIIFLANLELGFLTPPVGMNLFLSSYRFEEPLTKVYRYAVPFLVILILAVLLITYVPSLTTAPVEWVFGPQGPATDIEF